MSNKFVDTFYALTPLSRQLEFRKYVRRRGKRRINLIRSSSGLSLMGLAVSANDLPFAKLLVSQGVNANYGHPRSSTLHIASCEVYHPNLPLIAFLLDSGADPLYNPWSPPLADDENWGCAWGYVSTGMNLEYTQLHRLDELFRRDVQNRVSLAIRIISHCSGINARYFDATALSLHISEYLTLTTIDYLTH
jgi:hypothetical protein